MSQATQRLTARQLFDLGPLIPVLVIERPEHALPIGEALLKGGIRVLEITLRTPAALPAIEALARELPEAVVGAGTVSRTEHLRTARDAGARFLISPGLTPRLLEAAADQPLPLIPGIATLSELMTGLEYGLDHFKFFPAATSGGPPALKAIAGPFPDPRFCPTGGINPDNAGDYLAQPNVACVGGSWLVRSEDAASGDWGAITRRCRDALARLGDA